jgi:uncharacterized OB-fold protein
MINEKRARRARVPLREGLFTEDVEGGALLASRCQSCGHIFFPQRKHCLDCFSHNIEQVTLGRIGKLHTFTIVCMPTEHYAPPYAIGWVEFPEGVRVLSQIKGWESRPLRVGMELRLVIDTLWQDEEKEVIGYKFEPLSQD